jgi:ATP-dependent Lhr-like helicase
MLNLGTIPDQVAVTVEILSTKKNVGSIEEEFLMKLKKGDIFTLGGKLYEFQYSKGMKCYVSTAASTTPTIPPWFSEQLPLSYELANEISSFRLEFSKLLENYVSKNKVKKFQIQKEMPEDIDKFLSMLPVDENSKNALFGYFMEQLLFTKYIPNKELMLIEFTSDISEDRFYVIFHSLYGRRVNDALSRALAIEIGERLDIDVGVMVNDNGFMFTFDERPRISEKTIHEAFSELARQSLVPLMKKNVRKTEMMKRRFRHAAARSFMILRNYKGFKMGVGRQQVNAQIILKAVERMDPNFPILKETYREILNDVMDLPRAEQVLSKIRDGEIKYKIIETPFPSPFAHNLITFGHADVIMMKDRHMYLQELHKMVMKKIGST